MSTLSPLMATVNVAIGGAIGASARYLLGRTLTAWFGPSNMAAFPWATMITNVIGCLFMGVLFGWLARDGNSSEQARLLIGVGLLGGFTTFSAFGLEMMLLIERGQAMTGLLYALISVLAGLVSIYLGLIIMRLAA
ncbi:MAG: fluoride efflux transporter CrcB [Erythrobacter sp.]